MNFKKILFFVGLITFFVSFVLPCSLATAGEECGLYAQDPMVKISALPIDKDVDEVLAGISKDVSRDTGIEQQYITYYWQPLSNINCMGEKRTDGPILVDLYVPGFFDNEQIGSMITSLAVAIEKYVGLDRKWIFIQTHFPKQGQVYLSGEIQVWDDYKAAKNAAEYATP